MNELKKPRYAWTQLYEARKAPHIKADDVMPHQKPGRPERLIPVKKSTLYLSAGDESALKNWQKILTPLLGRKPSIGETSGILANILTERMKLLGLKEEPQTLDSLVALLAGSHTGE